jgi:hypothetical protein
MSVVVVMMLTFLFPPLWLRVLLDLGLSAGLISMTRRTLPLARLKRVRENHSLAWHP